METLEVVGIAGDSSLHALYCHRLWEMTETSKSWRDDEYHERVFVARIAN